jgi:hypothetical protein
VTSIEAYNLFLKDYNEMNRHSEVVVSKADFVLLFNRDQRRFVEETVPAHNTGHEIQDLTSIMVPYQKLSATSVRPKFVEFNLPDNFFRAINSYSVCEKGACKNVPVANSYKNIKPQDVETFLSDPNMGPSFEYQETLVTYMGNKMQVYKNDFAIKEQYVSYYKYPSDIDIAGSKKATGVLSTDVPPELPDTLVEKIVDRVVKRVSGIYNNAEGFQIAQERIQSEP